MTPSSAYRWTSASRSHVGRVRQINEDACLDEPGRGLWAVADGMGGHAHGDFASRLVVDTLDKPTLAATLAGAITETEQRLQAANRKLRGEAAARHARIIGSTAVVLLAREHRCGYLWAGDSRLYAWRGGNLRQLTRDHSQIEELKSHIWLASDDTLVPPSRNMLTRAIGATDTLAVDEGSVDVLNGDMFLLCSDGLSNELTDREIRSALVCGDCRHAAERLMALALERGGRDNISVVVVRADDPCASDKTMVNPAFILKKPD